jgi:hypothetical protein
VQSEKFVKAHDGRIGDVSIYGQESNHTTWRLAKLNLAIRGIDANIAWNESGSFHHRAVIDLLDDRHPRHRVIPLSHNCSLSTSPAQFTCLADLEALSARFGGAGQLLGVPSVISMLRSARSRCSGARRSPTPLARS